MKKKLFLDFMNEPALMTATRKSVKVTFYYKADIETLEKALEKTLNEMCFSLENEWTENGKGSVK